MAKIAQLFIPTSVIFDSIRLFFLFSIAVAIGYLLTDAFCKKYWETGKVKSLIIKQGPWKIHLHHWITGALAVIFINFLGFTMPIFLLGLFDGLIVHDIVYKNKNKERDWYRIIYKKETENI